ncbi:MAG: type II toxin-antitoxin system HicA family toxin [Acidobacteria bacterium]|nr:type II toxin-antitoxin system HicA family toxin [Acidobacteriota bacterium]
MKVREIIRMLEANKWQQVRQKGSHRSFERRLYRAACGRLTVYIIPSPTIF